MDYRPKSKTKLTKLLEENIRENLPDFGVGKDFLGGAQKAWTIKEKNV